MKIFETVIEETKDNSGDAIITLSTEVLEELGWKEGQLLNVEVFHGVLHIWPIDEVD